MARCAYIRVMARPRKGEEKNRPHRVAFHVSAAIRDRLEREAQRRNVSMADVANAALDQYFRKGNSEEHA